MSKKLGIPAILTDSSNSVK